MGGASRPRVVAAIMAALLLPILAGAQADGDTVSAGGNEKARMDAEGMVRASGGHFGTHSYEARVRTGTGGTSLKLGGSYDETDGFRDNGDERRWRASAELSVDLGEDWKLLPSGSYKRKRGGIPGFDDNPTPEARLDYESWEAGLSLSAKDFTSRSYLDDRTYDDQDPGIALDSRLRVRRYGHELSGKEDFEDRGELDWRGGYEFAGREGDGLDYVSEERAWFKLAYRFEPRDAPIDFGLGLAGDFRSEFEGALSPEASVLFGNGLFYLKFAFAMAADRPTLEQRYHRSAHIAPDPGLETERAATYRFIINSDPYGAPLLRLTFFYSDRDEAITLDRQGAMAAWANVGRSTSKGGELEFRWRASDWLRLESGYRYEESLDEGSGRRMPGNPRHRASLAARLTPAEGLSIKFEGEWVGDRYLDLDNDMLASDYYLAGLSAEYKKDKTRVFGSVENILGAEYLEGPGYEGRPLFWQAGIRHDF